MQIESRIRAQKAVDQPSTSAHEALPCKCPLQLSGRWRGEEPNRTEAVAHSWNKRASIARLVPRA